MGLEHHPEILHRLSLATNAARVHRRLELSRDPKVVELLAGSKLRLQPARLFATASPGLRRVFRISILGENLGVRATLVLQPLIRGTKFVQALVKPVLLSRNFATELGDQLFMELP